ncbi:MAG: type III-B CRISPR-associated protein Cas10/Cmr2 [Lentisphaeria bacterium]
MKFLLALSIGPVQDFIAAARRTRDLWFGSYLLSEISKATAKAVQEKGGILIFPAPENDHALEPDSSLNVANVIVAEIECEASEQVAKIADNAEQAAKKRWREFADAVFKKYQDCIHQDIWNDQVDDILECYAAWVPLTDDYQGSRKKLMRLLSGRKACRNFLPAKGRAGVPKSSLDGLRESVLIKKECPKIRLNEGEQLDVVGMVKRCWVRDSEEQIFYPSVSRVAADPWLRGCKETHIQEFKTACEDLVKQNVFHSIDTSEARGCPQYGVFPFEGTAVYSSRYVDIQKETGVQSEALQSCKKALQNLIQTFGEASPYFSILVADGDKMGAAIASIQSSGKHREFSQALAAFAGEARNIVQQNSGVLVYAGGDDVLAFVPLDKSVACSRSLYDAFAKKKQPWSTEGNNLSLSVGIAMVHFMEPLEDILTYGRIAEKHAKSPYSSEGKQKERDGFAVHLIKRGNSPTAVRFNWSENPDQYFEKLTSMLRRNVISGRFAYDLRELARVYEQWPQETVSEAIQKDVIQVLRKKYPMNKDTDTEVSKLVEKITDSDSLIQFSDSLLIARQMAGAMDQAEEKIGKKGDQ